MPSSKKEAVPYTVPSWFAERCIHQPEELATIDTSLTIIAQQRDTVNEEATTVLSATDQAHTASATITSVGKKTSADDDHSKAATPHSNNDADKPATEEHTSDDITMSDASSQEVAKTTTKHSVDDDMYQALRDTIEPTLHIYGDRAAINQPPAVVIGVDADQDMGLADAVVKQIAKDFGARLITCDAEDLEDLAMSFHSEQAIYEEDLRRRLRLKEAAKKEKKKQKKTAQEKLDAEQFSTTTKNDSREGDTDTKAFLEMMDSTHSVSQLPASSDKQEATETALQTLFEKVQEILNPDQYDAVATKVVESSQALDTKIGQLDMIIKAFGAAESAAQSSATRPPADSAMGHNDALDDNTDAKLTAELENIITPTPEKTSTLSKRASSEYCHDETQAKRVKSSQVDSSQPDEIGDKMDITSTNTEPNEIVVIPEGQPAMPDDTLVEGNSGAETDTNGSASDTDISPKRDVIQGDITSYANQLVFLKRQMERISSLKPSPASDDEAIASKKDGPPADIPDFGIDSEDEKIGKNEWCHKYDDLELNSPYAMTIRYMGQGEVDGPAERVYNSFAPCCSRTQHTGKMRDKVKARGIAALKSIITEQTPVSQDKSQEAVTLEDKPAVIIHVRHADLLLDQTLHGNIFKTLKRLILDCRRTFRLKVVLLVSVAGTGSSKKTRATLCSDPDCEACNDIDDFPSLMRMSLLRRDPYGRAGGCRRGKMPRQLAKALSLTQASYLVIKSSSTTTDTDLEETTPGIAVRRLKRVLRHTNELDTDNELFRISTDWLSMMDASVLDIIADDDMHKIRQMGTQITGRGLAAQRSVNITDIILVLERLRSQTDRALAAHKDKEDVDEKVATARKDFDERLAKVRKTCDDHERRILDAVVKPYALQSTYDDVILDEETKTNVKQLVSLYKVKTLCKSDKLMKLLNINGAMFYGPPGTGKTHLCRAMANDHNACMLAIDPAVVRNKWVGDNEKLVKATFTVATKLSPCIVFIDEADSLFGRRSGNDKSWERASLDIFLTMMDGIHSDKKGPFVVVATNRPADLDEAFLRRLPHKVLFKLPKEEQRAKILGLFLGKDDVDDTVDIQEIAKQTDGYSGSDLKTLCGQAVLAWATEKSIDATSGEEEMQIVLGAAHFKKALKQSHATVSKYAVRELEDWQSKAMGGDSVELQHIYT